MIPPREPIRHEPAEWGGGESAEPRVGETGLFMGKTPLQVVFCSTGAELSFCVVAGKQGWGAAPKNVL